MLLARWLLCMKGCELEGGSARLSLWSVLARQTSRQALALPWLLGGARTPCAAWAAVPVSHPRGETCSSDSRTTASHLAFDFASVAGSAGLLCWGGIQLPLHTSPLPLCSEVLGDCRGSSGGGSQFMVGVRPGPPPINARQPSQSSPAQHAPLAS